MFEERLINREDDLENLCSDWDALFLRSGYPTPFMSWEWISTWWKYLGQGTLSIRTLSRNGKLLAAAFLFSAPGPFGMSVSRLIGTGESDYLVYLVEEENSEDLYV